MLIHSHHARCLFVILLSGLPAVAEADPPAAVIERGKAATALIIEPLNNWPTGAAICVDPAGVFVTNLRLTVDHTVDMVIRPGQKGEQKVKARVVYNSKSPTSAVLVVEGAKDLVALQPRKAEPIETEKLLLVGYPTAHGFMVGPQPLPPVRVELTRVRGLRHVGSQLDAIEMDANLPEKHSGGPLLDDEGRLVGVVYFSFDRKGALAFPAWRLSSMLSGTRIVFNAPTVPYSKRNEQLELDVRVEKLGKPVPAVQLELELSTRPGERRLYKPEIIEAVHRFRVAPIPPQENRRITLDLQFDASTVKLETPDLQIKLDAESIALSRIDRMERRGDMLTVVRADGATFNAKTLAGLVEAEISGKAIALDLALAKTVTVGPPTPQAKEIRFRLTARKDGEVLASEAGVLAIEGIPTNVATGLTLDRQPIAGVKPKMAQPAIKGDRHTIELGEPFAQVCTGGSGRYLVFQLPKARKLAVVDVSEARILGHIDMPADEVLFAAGFDRLMLALPAQKLLQRWNLNTLKRDQTVALPGEETPFAVRMGSNARNPLFLYDGKEVGLWDVERMLPIPIQGKRLTPRMPGEDLQMRVSAGGQAAVAWDAKFSARHALQRLDGNRSTLLDGPGFGPLAMPSADGALVLRGSTGLSGWNMRPIPNILKGRILLPCEDPRFFLAVLDKPGKTSTVEICTTADRRNIFSIEGLDPLANDPINIQRGHFQGEPRARYLPHANLLVMLPETNDRVVLRPFNLSAELAATGRDYLFVVSSPPTHVRRGALFLYPLEVISKSGGLSYTLDVGQKGMSVSKEGVVHWEAPAQIAAAPVRVAITVRDDQGKEALHAFDLAPE